MIPYISFTGFQIGPVTIYIWGLLVALGILVGASVNVWLAKQRRQDPKIHWDLAFWSIVGAFMGARIAHVLFYDPEYYFENLIEIFKIWNGGFSIMGGFVGAAIAGVAFLRMKKLDVWAYVDTAMFGLPIGMFIGRIGCFLIHDHPGTATSFFLGVEYPDGVVRHDLGLYESLAGLFIAIVFFVLWRRKAPVGAYMTSFLLLYGTTRFFLDFLRATEGTIVDTRYAGLTPAQYGAIIMVGFGVFSWWYFRKQRLLSAKY